MAKSFNIINWEGREFFIMLNSALFLSCLTKSCSKLNLVLMDKWKAQQVTKRCVESEVSPLKKKKKNVV